MKLNQFDSVNLNELNLIGQVLNLFIGIYLDQSLSLKEHVTPLNNKISTQLGLSSGVRNSLTV